MLTPSDPLELSKSFFNDRRGIISPIWAKPVKNTNWLDAQCIIDYVAEMQIVLERLDTPFKRDRSDAVEDHHAIKNGMSRIGFFAACLNPENGTVSKGVSLCVPDDFTHFCKEIGMEMAMINAINCKGIDLNGTKFKHLSWFNKEGNFVYLPFGSISYQLERFNVRCDAYFKHK